MAKCKTCGAPVNLAPDGDPKYEPPRAYRSASPDPVRNAVLELDQLQSDIEMLRLAVRENDPKAEIEIRISDVLKFILEKSRALQSSPQHQQEE